MKRDDGSLNPVSTVQGRCFTQSNHMGSPKKQQESHFFSFSRNSVSAEHHFKRICKAKRRCFKSPKLHTPKSWIAGIWEKKGETGKKKKWKSRKSLQSKARTKADWFYLERLPESWKSRSWEKDVWFFAMVKEGGIERRGCKGLLAHGDQPQ